MKKLFTLFLSAFLFSAFTNSHAASGEMGQGIPTFGFYTAALDGSPYVKVWTLKSPAPNFPSGCTALSINSKTIGMDSFKIAYSTLLTAVAAGIPVRFYAHVPRDGGCGVDYIQLLK